MDPDRIGEATNLVTGAIDFGMQERRGTVRLAQSKNVLTAVAYCVLSELAGTSAASGMDSAKAAKGRSISTHPG